MSSQESHICFNKCSNFLEILMGIEFIEEALFLTSKVFIDYLCEQEEWMCS